MVDGTVFHHWLGEQFHHFRLPGLAAVLVEDGEILSALGYGYADLEQDVPVTPDTPFLLSSLTKPLSAALILLLAAEGLLDLDAPMRRFYRDYDAFCDRLKRYARDGVEPAGLFRNYNGSDYEISVRHHLTHTSQGVPGSRFSYNGFLYGVVSRAVEGAVGKPFIEVFRDRLILPLGLQNTSPHTSGVSILPLHQPLARPYYVHSSGVFRRSDYPEVTFNASAGLVASARDLALFDLALDQGNILPAAVRSEMWTPYRLKNGSASPYGIGWYVQPYEDLHFIWHTGWWHDASSAIYLKIPERSLTLILLANGDGLCWEPVSGGADILDSPLVQAFVSRFV